MILQTYTINVEVLNEILELYKFIVEKYAAFNEAAQIINGAASFLKQIWNHFDAQVRLS